MCRALVLTLLAAGLLSACSGFGASGEQPGAAETLAARIVQSTLAANAATQTAALPTHTLTPTVELASPTPSVAPATPTPTPTQDPADPRLTLGDPDWSDPFADGSTWYTYRTDRSSAQAEGGQFVMTMTQPLGYPDWTTAGPTLYDFYLEVYARTGPQCAGQDHYGLFFRAPDPNRGYLLAFSCDGKYRLQAWDGAAFITILNWNPHPAIAVGPGALNRVGVKVDGTNIGVYANGVHLGTYSDATFPTGGKFGLLVAAAESPEFTVYYDDLAYWALP
ncbi:MAG: hypothetical protein HYZ26_01575 [Chloroflexi bacterium]|nr:hypothetical protein [Chloroflexota bacterium]